METIRTQELGHLLRWEDLNNRAPCRFPKSRPHGLAIQIDPQTCGDDGPFRLQLFQREFSRCHGIPGETLAASGTETKG